MTHYSFVVEQHCGGISSLVQRLPQLLKKTATATIYEYISSTEVFSKIIAPHKMIFDPLMGLNPMLYSVFVVFHPYEVGDVQP